MRLLSAGLLAAACGAVSLLSPTTVSAVPVGVDGVIGGEWSGSGVVAVDYNPAAPTGNFGAPTNENHIVGYDIYTRGDSGYFYVGLQTKTNGSQAAVLFANLYFNTNLSGGSDLGFEVTNNQAFIPGVPGYYSTIGQDISYSLVDGTASTPAVLEAAFPWGFFTSDPLSMGFPLTTTGLQLRLSQSFGYSVAGGASYGDNRLGTVAVPEGSAFAFLGAIAGISGVAAALRRRFR